MAAEKNFENKIKRFLDSEDIWYVKFFANAYTRVGVPDILACVNGLFVGIEVKAEKGRPSELQLLNIEEIRQCGGFAVVVYPSGFDKLKKLVKDLKNNKFDRNIEMILK